MELAIPPSYNQGLTATTPDVRGQQHGAEYYTRSGRRATGFVLVAPWLSRADVRCSVPMAVAKSVPARSSTPTGDRCR